MISDFRFRISDVKSLIVAALMALASLGMAGEVTNDPIAATVQVRYRNGSGSGTIVGPHLVLTCAHIHNDSPAGSLFTISKHYSDGSDNYRGYLLAAHDDLDLALVAVPEADFDYVLLAAAPVPTPQAASWYGHAGARPEILSFKGYIARGYSTNFDIVRGHDSIEGQSGGGVFTVDGKLAGVMHGRPNSYPTSNGGGIFTPVRRIFGWVRSSCQGSQCQPYVPRYMYGQSPGGQAPPPATNGGTVTPPPPRPGSQGSGNGSQSPVPTPDNRPPTTDLTPLIERLDKLTEQLATIQRTPGPQGPPGPSGPAGERGPAGPAADVDGIANDVLGRLPPFYVQVIGDDGQPLGPPAAVSLGGTLNLHHRIVEGNP